MSNSQDLAEVIYSILPPDGAAIGNATALTQVQRLVGKATAEEYAEARDALVSSGRAGTGP